MLPSKFGFMLKLLLLLQLLVMLDVVVLVGVGFDVVF